MMYQHAAIAVLFILSTAIAVTGSSGFFNVLDAPYPGTRTDGGKVGFGFRAEQDFSIVAFGYAIGKSGQPSTTLAELHTSSGNGAPGPVVASVKILSSSKATSGGYAYEMLDEPYKVTAGKSFRLYRQTSGKSTDAYNDCDKCSGRKLALADLNGAALIVTTGHSVANKYGGGLDTSTAAFPRYTGAVTFFVATPTQAMDGCGWSWSKTPGNVDFYA